MKKIFPAVFFVLAGMLFLSAGCSKSGAVTNSVPPAPPPHTEIPAYKALNVVYGSHARNTMDVYLPANRTDTTPFVILLNGGGWTGGSKEDLKTTQELLLNRGAGSAAVNYRYVNTHNSYKELMQDVLLAVKFCQSQAAVWKIRQQKYIISGPSAGGHLSLLFGYHYAPPGSISGIISFSGPTDFTTTSYLDFASLYGMIDVLNELAGEHYVSGKPIPAGFNAASPIKHINNIPTLLIHGDKDLVVPYEQAERLTVWLKAMGIRYKLITVPGSGHQIDLDNPANAELVIGGFLDWVFTYSR
ncbi:alpha/beta hydrolase [Chitinophaga nivalis]|uniref:Alpha/beta hydrolase n=1 Tax=Chitinophaga nivalis TaxID=2991709 RepID=A0ABT3IQW0_9BACT|nr:alpha/beta hydrolase [Chitinophaga nivalis]MCW3464165.1 alpha/beta hydrolase [Chitinophaga nivalis]MCW3486145.1 alpha/beta hydrolase [Chitinophaga nivalis]